MPLCQDDRWQETVDGGLAAAETGAVETKRPGRGLLVARCRHVDGAIEIETKIGLFLYDGTERRCYTNRCVSVGTNISRRPPRLGELGVLLEYRHRYPSSPESRSSRRLCPHHNLHGAIQELLRCGATHPKPGQVCLECGDIQYCRHCRTKVLDLRQSEDTATGLVDSRCDCSSLLEMQIGIQMGKRAEWWNKCSSDHEHERVSCGTPFSYHTLQGSRAQIVPTTGYERCGEPVV